MLNFKYCRPADIESAVATLSENFDAKIVAGGMTLLPTLKLRLNEVSQLVDLGSIKELRGISEQDGRLTIGAMTRHVDVARDGLVQAKLPALAALAGGIGDVQVRNRGTMGGSVANNDPSADYPAACLGLDARLQTTSRTITVDDFFQGLFTTALEPEEILTSISFRIPKRAAYQKFRAVASGYAVVGVFVAQFDDEVRVAVTGAGEDGVFRLHEAERRLDKEFSPESLDDLQVPVEGMMSEFNCRADFRAHLVGVMTRRAVAKAIGL